MKLFIRIKDGQPFEHPIFEDNFIQAFPGVDIENLPPEFALFERVETPEFGPYDKNQRVQYVRGEDGIYRDEWFSDKMTIEEIEAKQNEVKSHWESNPDAPKSWTFDETLCHFVPPVPYPTTGEIYNWDEESLSWTEISTIVTES